MNHSQRFGYLLKNPQLTWIKPRRLFMLSHMRSRSSLLSHILGSNEEIIGYSELSIKYKRAFSLIDQKIALHQDGLKFDSSNILYDKILHKSYDFRRCSDIDKVSCNAIILVRQPVATVKSIVTMGRKRNNLKYSDVDWACEYYSERLNSLAGFAKKLDKFIYLNSDDIVDNTETTLTKLSKALNLKSPLSNEYSSFNKTGKEKSGDTSNNIKMGKIVRTAENSEVEIPEKLAHKMTEQYLDIIELIKKRSL
ncbi:sulfotransferase family protein [Alteromonas macleodii]|uniref:Sulfotransferase family protein n=1 Tax=Alteromonas macleodii TaxID=28108 RepID=A0A6T9Y2A7_ALTMA|nr:sulfotransferase family protein [Alteromonas macleodii]CAB9493547.1 conserved protein of unknown function [Alteromonas macleodii]